MCVLSTGNHTKQVGEDVLEGLKDEWLAAKPDHGLNEAADEHAKFYGHPVAFQCVCHALRLKSVNHKRKNVGQVER